MFLSTLGEWVDREHSEELLEQLLAWADTDGWAYPSGERDLSCTHYAMFGLDAAEQAGLELDARDWERARKAVLRYRSSETQVEIDGERQYAAGFGYYVGGKEPRASLVAAGCALLELCNRSEVADLSDRDVRESRAAIERGRAWLDANWRVDTNVGSGAHQYYHLLAVERAGVLCDWDELAGLPWYEVGAAWLLDAQAVDGAWHEGGLDPFNNAMSDTAFGILFLKRAARGIVTGGDAPVLGQVRSEGPGVDVSFALRGHSPVTAWILDFGPAARAALGAAPLIVERVEYWLDGELAATVKGGAEVWDGEQLAARLMPRWRGRAVVQARVHLAPEGATEGATGGADSEPAVLMSEPLELEVTEVLEP